MLVVDKPLGWTSTDVVRKVKFMLRHNGLRNLKVGHAGTLDPLATGVLVVCLGKATKSVEALQAEEKEYVAEMKLGATTPSFDMEHPEDAAYPWEHITREEVEQALAALTGERAADAAALLRQENRRAACLRIRPRRRRGETPAAPINIYAMELLEYDLPRIRIRVVCSKGTYIRSLAREIGEALGSGAYLTSLRRTRSGRFTVEEGYSMDEIINILK